MHSLHVCSSSAIKARISNAQNLKLPWSQACSPTLLKTVQAYADAVGAPKEYVFFPHSHSYSISYEDATTHCRSESNLSTNLEITLCLMVCRPAFLIL